MGAFIEEITQFIGGHVVIHGLQKVEYNGCVAKASPPVRLPARSTRV
jgi:hypothetical protein